MKQLPFSPTFRLRWPLLILMASIGLTALAAFDAQSPHRGNRWIQHRQVLAVPGPGTPVGAVRASLGIPSNKRDIDRAIEVVESLSTGD